MQGPDIIRSQSRNPKTFFLDYDATFDFLANVPEANHAVSIRSLLHMNIPLTQNPGNHVLL